MTGEWGDYRLDWMFPLLESALRRWGPASINSCDNHSICLGNNCYQKFSVWSIPIAIDFCSIHCNCKVAGSCKFWYSAEFVCIFMCLP